MFKQTVDYYRGHGSHVFVCFIDFSKAFDYVNYWKLFYKLFNDNVSSINAVRVLAYWHSHQDCFIRWCNCISAGFYFSNGTPQGGVLSLYLFSRYIRNLVQDVSNSGIGCRIADCVTNMFVYADDLILLAPSWEALQQLLTILHAHAI